MRGVTGAIALAAACALAPAATAAAASSGTGGRPGPEHFGVRLADVPADEARNPRDLTYIVEFVHPGMVVHRRIMVTNDESRSAHLTVYPDAAKIVHGMFVGDAGHTRSELTRWVHVAHPAVALRAGQSRLDKITIRVPRKATRGEHYGVIWVQQVTKVRSARKFAIEMVARVGIRIYLAVGRGGAPPTRFAITRIKGFRGPLGRLVLTAHVTDTGGRAVDLDGAARLTGGPGGTSTGSFPAQRGITLAPGQSGIVRFMLSRKLPPGPWQATVRLVSGVTVRQASASVLFYGSPGGVPWLAPGLVAAALLLATALLTAILARRLRRIRPPRSSAA